jgi:hypothetical protein
VIQEWERPRRELPSANKPAEHSEIARTMPATLGAALPPPEEPELPDPTKGATGVGVSAIGVGGAGGLVGAAVRTGDGVEVGTGVGAANGGPIRKCSGA